MNSTKEKNFLYKCFKTDDFWYVLDPGTNYILKMDEYDFEIFQRTIVNDEPLNDILLDLANKYDHVMDTLMHEQIQSVQSGIKYSHDILQEAIIYRNLFKPIVKVRQSFVHEMIKDYVSDGLTGLCLELTRQCNLRCSYCSWQDKQHNKPGYSGGFMTFMQAKKAIDYLITHSIRRIEIQKNFNYINNMQNGFFRVSDELGIGFYGGEPTLNFSLVENVVNYCRTITEKTGQGFLFHITSNFCEVTEEQMEFCINNRIHILISLDGPRHINDRYRKFANGEGTFDCIMNNVRKYRQLCKKMNKRSECSFNSVLVPPTNYDEIYSFFDQLNEEFGDSSRFSSCKMTDSFCANVNQKTLDERNQNIFYIYKEKGLEWISNKDCTSISQNMITFIYDILGIILNRTIFPKSFCHDCGVPRSGPCLPAGRLYLSSDLKYYPCERIAHNAYFEVGDLDSGLSVEKIETLIKRDFEMTKEKCKNCWAIRYCRLCYKDTVNQETFEESCKKWLKTLESTICNTLKILEKNVVDLEKLSR
ncbi:MAG: radical SAM protein [Acholeplasma sp.]|jgi:uncharacterized protein|nr:MAG: radical SAM protein [Acholeplasma sp.]